MLLSNLTSFSAEQNGLSGTVSNLFPEDASFEPQIERQITIRFSWLYSVLRYFVQYRTTASAELGTIKVIGLPRRKQTTHNKEMTALCKTGSSTNGRNVIYKEATGSQGRRHKKIRKTKEKWARENEHGNKISCDEDSGGSSRIEEVECGS